MKRFVFIIVLVIAAIGLAVAAFTYLKRENKDSFRQDKVSIHRYSDKNLSLENIYLTAVYFVPSDEDVAPEWKEKIAFSLGSLKTFHEFQFAGYSKIEYKILGEPIMGKEGHVFYDTENTNKGNPEALKRSVAELEEKYPGISLSSGQFGASYGKQGVYNILVIFYQGVGAVSSENVVLVNFDIFRDKNYEIFRDSILYHEFGHAIGLPDEYNEETGRSFGYDIMGIGRNGPLENAFIDFETKKSMGLK